jgi:predicted transcriptional regulator
VPNDISARPLNRGVLDGDLLYNSFEALPLEKQREITAQIGTTVEAVTDDLEELRAIW